MKIIHICSVRPQKPNGIKTVLENLAPKQIEAGHQVRVFSINSEKSNFEDVNSIRKFIQNINLDKPDIVIFHSIYYLLYIPFAIILMIKRIPYAIELHGALSKENYKVSHIKKVVANFIFFKKFIKKAKSIIYLNIQEYNNSIVKTINPKCTIIPNGCNSIENLQSQINLGQGLLNIIYIGRIERVHKGLDVLLDAIDIINKEKAGLEVKLSFYGDGNSQELEWFTQRISSINHIVEFYGPIYGEEKDRVMRNANMFILTSRSEGMPMGVLEALSYGLPCILTPGTNIGDEVKTAGAGWLTDANPIKIAEAINNAVTEFYKNFNVLRNNAIELAKKYDWSNIAIMSINEYQYMIIK